MINKKKENKLGLSYIAGILCGTPMGMAIMGIYYHLPVTLLPVSVIIFFIGFVIAMTKLREKRVKK